MNGCTTRTLALAVAISLQIPATSCGGQRLTVPAFSACGGHGNLHKNPILHNKKAGNSTEINSQVDWLARSKGEILLPNSPLGE